MLLSNFSRFLIVFLALGAFSNSFPMMRTIAASKVARPAQNFNGARIPISVPKVSYNPSLPSVSKSKALVPVLKDYKKSNKNEWYGYDSRDMSYDSSSSSLVLAGALATTAGLWVLNQDDEKNDQDIRKITVEQIMDWAKHGWGVEELKDYIYSCSDKEIEYFVSVFLNNLCRIVLHKQEGYYDWYCAQNLVIALFACVARVPNIYQRVHEQVEKDYLTLVASNKGRNFLMTLLRYTNDCPGLFKKPNFKYTSKWFAKTIEYLKSSNVDDADKRRYEYYFNELLSFAPPSGFEFVYHKKCRASFVKLCAY